LVGSVWFTVQDGSALAGYAATGALNLSMFEHKAFPLEQVNAAISGIEDRHGGFSNYVIHPIR
jgi:basic membrane lipoprotein Med (substrate-binding protein (PBP1-ABC) superfamily)